MLRIFRVSSWIAVVFMLTTLLGCEEGKPGSKGLSSKTFNDNLGGQPTTLNVFSSMDAYASYVQGFVMETLAIRDIETYKWKPALATSWEISKDGQIFTFHLREGVKWQDGRPFTAEDVKFSFDALMDKDNKYKTATKRPYLENIESCTVLDAKTVQFKTKTKYFGNFDVVAGGILLIAPKHLYKDPSKEQEKVLNKTLVGTGPYRLVEWRKGNSIILEQNSQWWGRSVYPEDYKFERIRMRFIKDGSVALQRLEKGDLDFQGLSAEEYVKKTEGKKWGKEVFKVKYQNQASKGYGFIGWNLKKPMFKEREVRVALSKLVDREKMIEKFSYGLNLPATGPWYRQSIYADPEVKPILFDPKGALELLRKNGWSDSDGDQILDKKINGVKTPFRFTLLNPNQEFNKYLVIFQQDAKKVGIDIQIKVIEWNTFISLLNERNFDSVILAWSAGSVDMDPKQIWHSTSAANGGSNFTSYKNAKVDKLIDEARKELDKEKRIPLMRKIYREIADDAPYVFLFNAQYGFYAYRNNVLRPKDTYKYSVGQKKWSLKKIK